MSSVTPVTAVGALSPTTVHPKHSPAPEPAPKPTAPTLRPPAAATAPWATERRHGASTPASTALSTEALSSTDVSYVESLMGAFPAQKMEEILLKTGIPIPANLGPNIDTSA